MVRVTRRYAFAASHRLHAPQLAPEENQRIYGKCNNPYGHGHNYVLEVSVRGPVDAETGRAVDLTLLDQLVQRAVLEPFDHRHLNTQVAEFASLVPTTENVALVAERRLREQWLAGWPRLEKIRIAETERNIFEVNGCSENESR